jgi:hypothetical protein
MIILKDENIRREIAKPWCRRTVDRYLSDMLRWIEYGYAFTEKQIDQLEKLVEVAGNEIC